MTADKLRFRCYQCQALLSASAGRAGSVIACPKCGTELIVPEAAQAASTLVDFAPPDEPEPLPEFASFLDLSAPPTRPREARAEDVALDLSQLVVDAPRPAMGEGPPPLEVVKVAVATIAERAGPSRRNDVVLPRTAAVLWSLGSVLGLASAFAAGLLAGHYIWVR